MNSEINLKHFGSSGSSSGSNPDRQLVGPPRRIISRYVVPLLLMAGFVAVGVFAFRESFTETVSVMVTMPVSAPDDTSAQFAIAPAKSDAAAPARQSLFQAPGWIEPEPYPIMLSSLRMGTVESIEVIEGESVTSGAVIARLVDEDARLAVNSAQSALKLKEARYQAALDHWKNPTTLVESIETAQAKQQQLNAEAQRIRDLLELARVEARVGNTLSQGGYEASLETLRKETELSASKNQLEETHAEMRLNSATLSAATERLSLRIEDREAVETAKAELLAAQTALATAQLQLERSVIRTPTSGTIMRLMAAPGSMISGEMADGMTIATLYKPEKLQVRVDVPLAEAAKVLPGLPAEITVEALPEKTFRGELVNIVPEFDLQKNVLPVKVRIYDPDLALRPEMIARVEFFRTPEPKPFMADQAVETTSTTTTTAASSLLLVPEEVIIADAGKSIIMVAGPDGTAISREVEAAPLSDGTAAVRTGLQPSDKIIMSPAGIKPGTPVSIKGFIDNDNTH